MTNWTNHEKTEIQEGLFDNYSGFEKILVFVGLESLVVFLRAKSKGYEPEPVISSEEQMAYRNVTIGNNVDLD
ncbi:MAG: hypothetical protein WAV40_03675 [Microgenomates group bacterium]